MFKQIPSDCVCGKGEMGYAALWGLGRDTLRRVRDQTVKKVHRVTPEPIGHKITQVNKKKCFHILNDNKIYCILFVECFTTPTFDFVSMSL